MVIYELSLELLGREFEIYVNLLLKQKVKPVNEQSKQHDKMSFPLILAARLAYRVTQFYQHYDSAEAPLTHGI